MTTFKTLLLAGVAGVLFAGPAAACPAKIGAVLSMTGSYATFGPPISNAAALAVEQLNAAGWKVGDCSKLEYIVRDDQTQPSVGVDAARRLVDLDAVGAIVGPVTSGVTGPVLTSVTVDKGVLVIVSASSSPTFTEMARQGKPLSELAKAMTVYPQVMINVKGVDHHAVHTDEELRAAVASVEESLGETGRVLLRPSGTEPLVRVMVEAADQPTAERLANELAVVVRDRLTV